MIINLADEIALNDHLISFLAYAPKEHAKHIPNIGLTNNEVEHIQIKIWRKQKKSEQHAAWKVFQKDFHNYPVSNHE